MTTLSHQPNALAEWHALVGEAQLRGQSFLDEQCESYLVYLLMRFTDQPTLSDSVLAIDFLEAQQQADRLKSEQLRDVGDKCLLLSGLFPDHIETRQVNEQYFISLGQSAYHHIHTIEDNLGNDSELYRSLCERFGHLVDTLRALREDEVTRGLGDFETPQIIH